MKIWSNSLESETRFIARQVDRGLQTWRTLLLLRMCSGLILVAASIAFSENIIGIASEIFRLKFVFYVVHYASTYGVRTIFALQLFVSLALILMIADQISPLRNNEMLFGGTTAVVVAGALAIWCSPVASIVTAAFAGVLVGCNAISRERWRAILAHPTLGRFAGGLMWSGIGVEAMLPRPFLLWAKGAAGANSRAAGEEHSFLRILPGAALASVVFALCLPYAAMMEYSQALFTSRHVSIVFGPHFSDWSKFDVSDIALDAATGNAFLCGDSQVTPKVLPAGAPPAIDLGVSNGGNEFCEFSEKYGALLTVTEDTDNLLMIDAVSRGVERLLHLPSLPKGEVFLSVQPNASLAVIASENTEQTRSTAEIRVVDLDRFAVVREIDADVGYLITHPTKPIFYINHFMFDLGVRAYDMRTGQKLASSRLFGRSDRMAFDAARNEVLATDPESAKIRRFNATTLAEHAPIDTVYSARGLGIDAKRDLLLVSSFFTNEVEVIDLKTGQSLRRYWVGPWLRDVVVNAEGGFAYVASRYGVYRLNYLE
jgi:hypothetical protein